MNRLQEHLVHAANELGLRVIVPFEVRLSSGRKLLADALLPDIGYRNGTIVGQSFDDFVAVGKELRELGYGYSVYGEPLETQSVNVESYAETFKEWGWCGETAKRPEWFSTSEHEF